MLDIVPVLYWLVYWMSVNQYRCITVPVIFMAQVLLLDVVSLTAHLLYYLVHSFVTHAVVCAIITISRGIEKDI